MLYALDIKGRDAWWKCQSLKIVKRSPRGQSSQKMLNSLIHISVLTHRNGRSARQMVAMWESCIHSQDAQQCLLNSLVLMNNEKKNLQKCIKIVRFLLTTYSEQTSQFLIFFTLLSGTPKHKNLLTEYKKKNWYGSSERLPSVGFEMG